MAKDKDYIKVEKNEIHIICSKNTLELKIKYIKGIKHQVDTNNAIKSSIA